MSCPSVLSRFLGAESGAVTVDWTVLTAALAGLGIASAVLVSGGVEDLSHEIAGTSASSGLLRTGFGPVLGNGSFENIEGFLRAGWGFYSYNATMQGWQEISDERFEVVMSGYSGVTAADGDYMLDMDASPGNLRIGQTLTDVRAGSEYTVSFAAADPQGGANGNGVNVWFGGELVGTVTPGSARMQDYSFTLTGGAGDGSNRLEFEGLGREDNVGAYLDNIVVE